MPLHVPRNVQLLLLGETLYQAVLRLLCQLLAVAKSKQVLDLCKQ